MYEPYKPFIMLLPLALAACAHAPTDDLVNARRRYEEAAHGQANQLAPADVYEAKKALGRAERAHDDKPGSNYERDMAYIATRKAELAMARASMKEAETKAQDAEAARIATLEQQRNQTREQLEQAEGKLSEQEHALETAQAQREQLERRLSDATRSLEGMARIEQQTDKMVLTLNGAVLFKHNSTELLPIARERLREVAVVLEEYEEGNQIVVEGHTDARGGEAYNRDLSHKRAAAVRDFLVAEGVSESVITAVGLGESEPVASNATAEGRANNRRVEIVISHAGDAVGRTEGESAGEGGGAQQGERPQTSRTQPGAARKRGGSE